MNTELKVSNQLRGFARRLVAEGLLDESAALKACDEAAKAGQTVLAWLASSGSLEPQILATAASVEYGVPLLNAHAMDISREAASALDETLIQKHKALPLYLRGNTLFVALADPTDHTIIDELAFSSGKHVEPVIVPGDQLQGAIDRALSNSAGAFEDLAGEDGFEDVGFDTAGEADSEDVDAAVDETPVVRFINKILLDAIRKGASDIHFEPYEDSYRVRYRLDGVLSPMAAPPVQMSRRLSARLKVMSGLDIAEKRVPQDGRIKLNISRTQSMDFRVSTCPTLFGEKVVLRILDSSTTKLGIDKLGFDDLQQRTYFDAIKKPYGMILVTGPTGSGKTVTLYSALNILNDEGRNISTAEDPVEIRVPGINQVQQNEKQGMTFARALRSFLRQDPDIIMVGEIRDLETAEIAIKAAQTGHLVLSTLHTNDAPQTVTRLVNMGVPSYNITSALNVVIAQRLVRRLHSCKVRDDLPPEALQQAGFSADRIEDLTLFKPKGCNECNEGYKGRSGVFQVMPISDEIARIILADGNAMKIAEQSRAEGISDLRQSALDKVAMGITDLIEINRVTKD